MKKSLFTKGMGSPTRGQASLAQTLSVRGVILIVMHNSCVKIVVDIRRWRQKVRSKRIMNEEALFLIKIRKAVAARSGSARS